MKRYEVSASQWRLNLSWVNVWQWTAARPPEPSGSAYPFGGKQMLSLEDIERRLRALEDVEEIKRLKARYCTYCDDNYDADKIASLFVEDAIWDGGIRGKAEGRDGIRNFFVNASKRLPFAIHMVMNPIIEVNGDAATGIWYLFQACTYADGDRAVWGSARYDEEYVRVNGVWMFKHLKLTSHFWTPFNEGWVKAQFM